MNKTKKALIIFASPHANGKTAKVLSFLKEKIKSKFNFYVLNAFERNPRTCIDCGRCKEIGECVFYDLEDFEEPSGVSESPAEGAIDDAEVTDDSDAEDAVATDDDTEEANGTGGADADNGAEGTDNTADSDGSAGT